MASVSIHAPKTPVTKGSNGTAAATVPNVCKMPGPPAPFVPTPLPNIGKSGMSPQGYSTTVKIESNAVAIKGASFKSMGDIASKGTGGGIVSANTQGPTKFAAPGSMTVKIQGKNVHLLSDMNTNNHGSPANAADTGTVQATGTGSTKEDLECGEVGTYAELKKKNAQKVDMERDHVPSKAALAARARRMAPYKMNNAKKDCIKRETEKQGLAIAIPRGVHRGHSKTCGSRNKPLIDADSKSAAKMKAAAERDTNAIQKHLDDTKHPCADAYRKAAEKVKSSNESMLKKIVAKCKSA